jgi:hypothetical protein
MTLFRSISSQYLLETLTFGLLLMATLLPRLQRREPRALLVLTGLNVLRLGGVAGALAAMATSPQPAFLLQVAVGDGLTAALALTAFVLLWRKSRHALLLVACMNAVGLLGIVVSESWLQWLELAGRVTRSGFVHGPTIGAALFTTLHLLAFVLLRRQSTMKRRAPRGLDERCAPSSSATA